MIPRVAQGAGGGAGAAGSQMLSVPTLDVEITRLSMLTVSSPLLPLESFSYDQRSVRIPAERDVLYVAQGLMPLKDVTAAPSTLKVILSQKNSVDEVTSKLTSESSDSMTVVSRKEV